MPTKSAYLPPTDFTMPGWARVVDESGTIEPDEPLRSDEYPQPAELTFQLDGGMYDPSSVRVLGAELASRPSVEIVDGKPVINVTVLIPWNAIDKAGECPYIEDEFGNKLYRIRGRVFDAVPSSDGEHLPIAHASVRRERLDGENAGETFDTTADYDGFYSFETVPEGKYKIIASSPGYLDNYSDDDPDNDETRDLTEELQQYEDEIEKGRYEKQATDYHVIVWARPKIEMGPLADLTVSQVILEVRHESTLRGAPLNYAPAVRDERITTEALAERIGKILLAGASQTSPATKIRTPLNKWLRAGDGIRLTGTQVDLSPPESRPFQVTELRKVFVPDEPGAHDIVSSAPGKIGLSLTRTFSEDPLGTKVGTVVAVYRNELGGRVYDVEAEGSVFYGLKAWPVLGDLMVGEMVQVSRATKGAVSFLVVARTTELFGKERIVYV